MAFKRITMLYSFFHSNLVSILSFDIIVSFYFIFSNGKHICKQFICSRNPNRQFPEKAQSCVNIVTFSIGCYYEAALFLGLAFILHGEDRCKFRAPLAWIV